ncbi:MAG TPA: Mu transposase C-terminal domain-containing protein, partial [Herpetosiphonaceae bacterium]|nr:Mu transposase C-terminal domain-containing protein [Herpetosiphonaceae bacterium]
FTQSGQRPHPTLPLERVELDHTRVDLIVIDDQDNLPLGRPTLTYCLDLATRYPLGYYLGFEPPSYLAVMECLAHAIRPKLSPRDTYGADHEWQAYGLPVTLVVDNGKEFHGQSLQDACAVLGIALDHSPVQTPQFKAGIERLFGTMNTGLFHTLPGTTFGSVAQRGDYDSLAQACICLRDLQQMLTIFVVDIYAEQFHRGLNGVPARCWEQALKAGFVPRVPTSADDLLVLLGRRVDRVIQAYGIEFESLRYNCAALASLRQRLAGQRVKVKYHPADLSRVYVYDPFDHHYLTVPALAQEYTQDLSLWKHRVIRRTVLDEQGTVDLAALGRAKEKIQEIVTAARTQKRLRTRGTRARWEGEVPSQAESTPPDPVPPVVVPHASAAPDTAAPPHGAPDAGWSITYPTLPWRRR